MDSKLLDYYNRELAYLHEMGAEFAAHYPKVAGRLGMRGIDVADPYVERMLEGFAFLTSRVQLKMDAEFPRFSQRMLEMIAPGYLSPTPSMAIAKLTPDTQKGDISNGFLVPRGTMMENQNLKKSGVTCSYTTAHDVMLQPLCLSDVSLGGVPADIPLGELKLSGLGAASALRIRIECEGVPSLDQLKLDDVILYLSGPDIQALKLLELLMQHRVGILLQSVEEKPLRRVLSDDALQQEGFAPEQALLPDDLRNFDGYRLLQEYFAFPARFQFISLRQLAPFIRCCGNARIFEIIILLDKADSALESVVDASHLALHCTPVINLFPKTAERLKISDSQHEYHLVVDNIRPLDYEVHSVQRLFATVEGKREEQIFRSFWSTFSGDGSDYGAYFSLRREQRTLSEQAQRYGTRTGYIGSEVFLSLVDEHHTPWRDDLRYLSADVMCTSRDLPLMLLQQDQGNFVMPDSIPVGPLTLCKGPTPPRPALAEGLSSWRLISHLQMNYLSLMDCVGGEGAAALRQLLSLYANLADAPVSRQIEAIRHCQLSTVNRRVPEPGPVVFARGVSITLEVDEQAFSGASPWLFGSVLERVFSRLVALNSFTEFTLNSQQRGEVGYWPPRMGKKALI
ncbi:type VI secretion system baseplate subunit TssF [Pectobacterium parmentieri]|uniref:type VI secretion system baseplate subunit TssF n=1 Tax=Pectobacterium parmentieri TaxID=1905730 RepID=UPI0018DF7818|nr:type VI secretion system baseplate subunit TssF [Pectobacterium parmentieri]MBI0551468.1 type VI secretion system baseplate subunit TssF [Pectobacterium parmentieri]MBI0557619.1 type VI secretion system baseplate subunit TssF [Pectobacterium parmentieri]MBI0564108.1 type VI secretion system baseplate subunit TssF [Pectobacterium parmentieri]